MNNRIRLERGVFIVGPTPELHKHNLGRVLVNNRDNEKLLIEFFVEAKPPWMGFKDGKKQYFSFEREMHHKAVGHWQRFEPTQFEQAEQHLETLLRRNAKVFGD